MSYAHALSLCLVIQQCLRGTPLGLSLRVIVNENPLNQQTTSRVISVLLLIYDFTIVR